MRILMLAPALGPVYGGPSKSIMELTEALGGQNCSVDLVSTNANGRHPLQVPLHQWIKTPHYRLQYFPCYGFQNYQWSWQLWRWLWLNIPHYDLVHTNALFVLPNLAAYRACQIHQVPYIITPRGMLEPWALTYRAWKKWPYYSLFERSALGQASAVHMLSLAEADQVRPLGLKPPLLITPNGIHRQSFEPLASPDRFFQQFPATRGKTLVLFLGRIHPKKGLDLLAQAFGKVHGQFPNTHLVIAGPDQGNFLPTVEKYFLQADGLEAVTFTGMLTGDLKQAALAAADVYVAPSYSEGFSMSVLEGMASGLPCVITTGCNFPEAAAAQVAHVVDPRADPLAAALSRCLQDPAAAKAMGQRARQFIFDHYTWDKIASDLIQVYAAIIEKRPIPPSLLAAS